MDLFQLEESCSSSICDARSSKRRGPIIIYEFEGCPFCRKVREAVSMLSLEVEYRPCPMGGDIFRKEIKQKFGAKATFPYLMDANNGVSMFESDDIIAYLFQAYGDGMVPWTLSRGSIWTTVSAGLAMLSRIGKGNQRKWSTPPTQPLVLWAYEGSPFCKIVREELCELEIAHCQISCPRGSPNRQRLLEKTGRFQVPYLEDPNNGVSLFESSAIIEYIQKMYGLKTSPVKYL
jgi:glutathione S-transferase